MVPMSHVPAFAAAVTVLIAIPGPAGLFTISRALTVGRKSTLYTASGNELGAAAQVVAVAVGAGPVDERSAQIFTVVKRAGAAYLIYLGAQAIRHRRSMAGALAAHVTPVRPLRAPRDGFAVGASKALVLDSAWAAAAGTARQWFSRSPRRLELIGGTGGLVMIGLCVSVAATGGKA